jgi:hypothetical protein
MKVSRFTWYHFGWSTMMLDIEADAGMVDGEDAFLCKLHKQSEAKLPNKLHRQSETELHRSKLHRQNETKLHRSKLYKQSKTRLYKNYKNSKSNKKKLYFLLTNRKKKASKSLIRTSSKQAL